jgi:N-acetylated-alpha-linked acidic dipeptidase
LGINLKGSIGIIRVGKTFRGTKIELAEKYGLVGVLLFPGKLFLFNKDPDYDGEESGKGKAFPNGPLRPSGSVLKGNIQFQVHFLLKKVCLSG